MLVSCFGGVFVFWIAFSAHCSSTALLVYFLLFYFCLLLQTVHDYGNKNLLIN